VIRTGGKAEDESRGGCRRWIGPGSVDRHRSPVLFLIRRSRSICNPAAGRSAWNSFPYNRPAEGRTSLGRSPSVSNCRRPLLGKPRVGFRLKPVGVRSASGVMPFLTRSVAKPEGWFLAGDYRPSSRQASEENLLCQPAGRAAKRAVAAAADYS